MSSRTLHHRLRVLLQKQRDLLRRLAGTPPLLRGSFARVHTRCGKPTCWCAQAASGHVHTRITWSQEGHMLTRKVPPKAIPQVIAWTGNYRRFRADRKKLQRLHAQIGELLQAHEATVISRTRKPLDFLDPRQKTPAPATSTPSPRQKTARALSGPKTQHTKPQKIARA
jgi:hypothetical protein